MPSSFDSSICTAHCFLDLLVRELDCAEHDLLRDLLHLTLDHQDVVDRTAYHDIEIGLLHLRESGVDDVLAADACHAYLRDRTSERNVRASQRRRSGKTCQSVGLDILVGRYEVDRNEYLGVIVRREEGTQCAVDKACNQNLRVAGLALALHETSRDAAACGELLLVFYLQGHEIGALLGLLGGNDRTQQHGIAHLNDNGAVGLFRELTGLDNDLAAVDQRNRFTHGIVQLVFFHKSSKNLY